VASTRGIWNTKAVLTKRDVDIALVLFVRKNKLLELSWHSNKLKIAR